MPLKRGSAALVACARGLVVIFAAAFLAIPAPASAQSWLYTAMGDSLAVGAWALRGYVPRYLAFVRNDNPGKTVSLRNLGHSGWNSGDLYEAVMNDENFRESIAASAVITFNIGGNDLRNAREEYKAGNCGGTDDEECLRVTVADFTWRWSEIIREIRSLRLEDVNSSTNTRTIIRTMDLYNPFVRQDKAADTNGDNVSDFVVFKKYVDYVNHYIAQTSQANGIRCAPVYAAFNGASGTEDPRAKGYLSFDGLHPNDTGHNVMATQFRNVGYTPLGPHRTGAVCNTPAPLSSPVPALAPGVVDH
jgi:lysophospholipase L1-like esterase